MLFVDNAVTENSECEVECKTTNCKGMGQFQVFVRAQDFCQNVLSLTVF